VALALYTALVDLEMNSVIASWPFPAGSTTALDPARASTIRMLAAGQIELAASGAVDNVTPANIERGMPGLHCAVSN
jgi:hypothetical protein